MCQREQSRWVSVGIYLVCQGWVNMVEVGGDIWGVLGRGKQG